MFLTTTSSLFLAMAGLISTASVAPSRAEAPTTKVSLDPRSAAEAWQEPGFRIGLGYVFTGLMGLDATPGGPMHSGLVRVGLRLDDQWLLFLSLGYGANSSARGFLRFGGTLEPTVEIIPGLTVSLGIGVAGLSVSETSDPPEPSEGVVASYTLPGTRPRLGACQGLGPIAVVRAQYALFVTRSFATGPAIAAEGQWTRCSQSLNRSNPDTGTAIELHQFWPSLGLSIGWLVLFR